jgi:hypothetical protein
MVYIKHLRNGQNKTWSYESRQGVPKVSFTFIILKYIWSAKNHGAHLLQKTNSELQVKLILTQLLGN